MPKLDNHVAIVTGASRGIGKAIAASLACEGARVVLVARTEQGLAASVEELQKAGLNATAHVADVSDARQVEACVSSTAEKFGRIDILVNNAGIGFFKPVLDMDVTEFDAMWNVNVRGVFLATKAVLPHMIRAKGGAVVNIASLAGKNHIKDGAAYCATKWALRGFAGSLMLEVRQHQIRVITIFPGSVDTSFSSRKKDPAKTPQPEDVADAVLFALTAPARSMFSEIDLRPTNP